MFKKENIKRILTITVWCLFFAGLIASFAFVSVKKNLVVCHSLLIDMLKTPDTGFIEESDIRDLIKDSGDSLINKKLSDINIGLLEKRIRNNPFVENAEVYSTIDGHINIDIKQRRPVLRIIGASNNSFYIDEKGVFMPLSPKFSAHVIVADGFIYEPYRYGEARRVEVKDDEDTLYRAFEPVYKYSLKDTLFTIASYIDSSTFWKSQVQEIYVTPEHEFEFYTTVGSHRIVFGNLENMRDKFDKLMVFYKEGLSKTGWSKYNCINLKYRNQVVCTKNNF